MPTINGTAGRIDCSHRLVWYAEYGPGSWPLSKVSGLMERIRLVIWDLDNTFWDGILTEGGMVYSPFRHDIVIELARRGIMSSICSNNDLDKVKNILIEHSIWEYFIFPDLGWGPKGERLKSIVDKVQLRPETILFIDDNPMNLGEARHYVPGMQVSDELFIPAMLADDRLQGKDDSDLVRLAQYKVLESRQADQQSYGADNSEFLRSSNIRISIEYDVAAHMERAIELINRTNQLNYTKTRLPEDKAEASAILSALLHRYDVFSGLIKVEDRYGDYGYVGLFVVSGSRKENFLQHFCFSCRTLNMGIETWIYRWLGRPDLVVPPDVLCDVVRDERVIDWISFTNAGDAGATPHATRLVDRLVLRGGCDLAAVSHYLSDLANACFIEHHLVRDDRAIRIDHSAFLGLALTEVPAEADRDFAALGYIPSDYTSAIANEANAGGTAVWFLSFWIDSFAVLYRHKQSGLLIPFALPRNPHMTMDVTGLSDAYLAAYTDSPERRAAVTTLKNAFEFYGQSDAATVRPILRKLVERAGPDTLICILLGPETWVDQSSGQLVQRDAEAAVNGWIRDELAQDGNVVLMDVRDFVEAGTLQDEPLHFDRLVYLRVAEAVRALVRSRVMGGHPAG